MTVMLHIYQMNFRYDKLRSSDIDVIEMINIYSISSLNERFSCHFKLMNKINIRIYMKCSSKFQGLIGGMVVYLYDQIAHFVNR